MCVAEAPYLRTLGALFVFVKIFLVWIFITAEAFHFQRTIKSTTNRAIFMKAKKKP